MTDTLIALDDVTRTFGDDPPVRALRGVDLVITHGEWVAVVGPSGSGKSTLLNTLGLLDRPSGGTYRLDGTDTSGLTDRQRAGIRATTIGMVFQSFHLLSYRTVVENVATADIYRRGDRRTRLDRARTALDRVHLGHRADYVPTRLSGGERQRVAIARAVVVQPRLLLCDEPTGNLDIATGTSILDLFAEMHRDGLTIVMITHDPEVANRSERLVRIVDGRLSEAA